MDITIQQEKWTLTSKFDICTPSGDFSATKNFFSFLTGYQVFDPEGLLTAKISSNLNPFYSQYTFELTRGAIFNLKTKSLWKGVYVCEGADETYSIYAHRGRNYSIFKGTHQIAAFTHGIITVGNGNVYDIRADDNADMLLIICMVLSIEEPGEESGGNTIEVDLGNIAEERPFDDSWQPNQSS